jgi:hypothetical protein
MEVVGHWGLVEVGGNADWWDIVMFHIFPVSETLITGLCHLQHTSIMPMVPPTRFCAAYVTSEHILNDQCPF